MDDLLSEFLTETNESLDVIDVELVKFESDPNDRSTLDNIFRLVHTIKGTCGFLGLPRLEAVAHAGETLLGRFREGALDVTPAAVTIVLQAIDQIKKILGYLESEGAEPEGDDGELIARLEAAAEGQTPPAPAAQPTSPPSEPVTAQDDVASESEPEHADVKEAPDDAGAGDQTPSADAEHDGRWDPDLNRELRPGEVSLAELEAAFQAAEVDAPGASASDDELSAEVEADAEADAPAEPERKPAAESGAPTMPAPTAASPDIATDAPQEPGAERAATSVSNQTIRVNVDVLENLMTMVSELVLTRNQLMQIVRNEESSEFKVPLQRLSSITAELQDGVMKTRMQPIGNAWKKLPRIVRDCGQDLGKKINFTMEGEETELDRQVLDLIKDPLTHMVRNSCDHGIETPEDRLMQNKPESGRLVLRAFHEGGHINIEIADDGAGLNTERIRRKAVEKGLLGEAEANAMSEAQIHRYIFHPGFSTAAKVTNLSGRGVGMDVVRTNIEQIGGTIDVSSVEGFGATFTIKIPLTLAIISALIVGAGKSRFAIPQLSVVELVRVGPRSETQIEFINETRVLRLRDRLLPLMDLADILSLPTQKSHEDQRFVIVMQVGGQRFGVIVDEVFDTEEIVVKPLSSMLQDIAQFSGNTILGDGSVIMIMDPNGLATNVRSAQDEIDNEANSAVEVVKQAIADEQSSMLIVRAGSPEPKATPLSLVTRLEEIDSQQIETSNGQRVVQYRGKLMPVMHLSPYGEIKSEGKQPMLVFTEHGRAAGLLVDEIVDVVDEQMNIELTADQPGMTGTAILRGQATDVIDVGHFITQICPDWFTRERTQDIFKAPQRVLLIDDSAFFRNVMEPVLIAAGYDTTCVASPNDAWKIKSTGVDFDVIVTDIDMPDTDGLTFAEQLNNDERWSHIPRVALSGIDPSQIPDEYQKMFADFVRKSDRDHLVSSLNHTLQNLRDAA